MFFSNEEHNLMVVLPDGRFIQLFFRVYMKTETLRFFYLNASEFSNLNLSVINTIIYPVFRHFFYNIIYLF